MDYTVRELSDAFKVGQGRWLPFPPTDGLPSTFRHTWILVHRLRPRVPVLLGAPLPRHAPGEQQQAALLVMAYFRPWTKRAEYATPDVPYAGDLRRAHQTWQQALESWLDGCLLSEESKRYIGNFLWVHRLRPHDAESDCGNSGGIIEDEELQLSSESLREAVIPLHCRPQSGGGCETGSPEAKPIANMP